MTHSLDVLFGIDLIVDPVRGVKGMPLQHTDRHKKTVFIFNNSAELAVFTDKMLELGVTYDDLTLKKP